MKMNKYFNHMVIGIICFLSFLSTTLLRADGDMTAQQPITKTIYLGNSKNTLQFYPDNLSFNTGALYKLVIKNTSQQKHYFIAEKFANSIFTRKVQILSHDGNTIAEVKGRISEIEVYPGGTTEWWFVPVKTTNSSRMHCSIKGHSESGMTGLITIK